MTSRPYYRLAATVAGGPVSVRFGDLAQAEPGSESLPMTPLLPGVPRAGPLPQARARSEGIAVARGTDGSVAASAVASFVPNP